MTLEEQVISKVKKMDDEQLKAMLIIVNAFEERYWIPDEEEQAILDEWDSMTREEQLEGSVTIEELADKLGIEL